MIWPVWRILTTYEVCSVIRGWVSHDGMTDSRITRTIYRTTWDLPTKVSAPSGYKSRLLETYLIFGSDITTGRDLARDIDIVGIVGFCSRGMRYSWSSATTVFDVRSCLALRRNIMCYIYALNLYCCAIFICDNERAGVVRNWPIKSARRLLYCIYPYSTIHMFAESHYAWAYISWNLWNVIEPNTANWFDIEYI